MDCEETCSAETMRQILHELYHLRSLITCRDEAIYQLAYTLRLLGVFLPLSVHLIDIESHARLLTVPFLDFS